MRRAAAPLAIAVALLASATAVAKSSAPPPPPPPPPSDSDSKSNADTKDSSDSKAESKPEKADSKSDDSDRHESDTPSGTSLRASDALLDASGGKKRPMMLSFFVGFEPYYYYGCAGYYGSCGFPVDLGARFAIPILHDGFLPMLNDSFEIEFGIDTNYYLAARFDFGFVLAVEPRWTFHLLPKFDVYAKPIAFGLGFYTNSGGWPFFSPVRFIYDPSVGLIYSITKTLALRAEIGVGQIKAGIGIAF